MQTTREDLLSGNNNIHLVKIVTLYRHYNSAEEAELMYQADIRWYEVPRDRCLGLDCTQVWLRRPYHMHCAFTFSLSCRVGNKLVGAM